MLVPSSRVTPRATLSAAMAAAASVPGRAPSVGCCRGVLPAARPTSPYWFVEYVFETVNSPCGATSIDSSDSRCAASVGQPTVAGVGAVCAATFTAPPAPTVSSVRPLNSETAPVTRTVSPRATSPVALGE